MVTVREKASVKTKVWGECPTHARTEIRVRDVSATIDEPVERGGTNKGPTPTEAALAALIGCTNVIGHRVAEKLGVDIGHARISAECDFDRRGTQLAEEVAVPFSRIKLRVEVDGSASQEDLNRVAEGVARFCPVSKLFRGSGTIIEEEWVARSS